jgi:uncharacterized protein with HEPN domain
MKDNLIHLRQIMDYIDDIDAYIKQEDFLGFESNSLIQDAVIRKIELIGEAAKRLSVSFWEQYRDTLPLAEAVSTRNRLIHQYDDIDLLIIWNTAKNDLPDLKKKLEDILKELNAAT